MARPARKAPNNYNEIRLATEARRRELVAKMRAARARTSETQPAEILLRAPTGAAVSPVSEIAPIREDLVPERRVGEGDVETARTGEPISESLDVFTEVVENEGSPEIWATMLDDESVGDSAADWPRRIGLADRLGLLKLAELLKETASVPAGTLRVEVSWPSPWPNPVLAWAARCVSGLDPEERQLRILFLGDGRAEMRALDTCGIPRASAAECWPPCPGTSSLRDAMRTAFVAERLRAGAPSELPLSALVPFIHVEAPGSLTRWKDSWDGFLGSARKHVNRKSGGRYGQYWEKFGRQPASCRPFGFLVPKISIEKRRSEEISQIDGPIDLVVVDLSGRSSGPWDVGPAVEQAALDLVAGLEHRKEPAPPILVLVSDPTAALAAMKVAGDLIEGELITRRVFGRWFWRGDRGGTPSVAPASDPVRLTVRAAFTQENEIVESLLLLANRLDVTMPKTAAALAEAAYMLCAMARTTRPPCADGRFPEEISRNFMDEETAVRDALREEGSVAEQDAVADALRSGREAATRLLRETPARLALKEAASDAQTGRRVVFVVDRIADALAAKSESESNLLVVHRSDALSEILSFGPDLLVLACRGTDALRILVEMPVAPSDVRILLTPHDAQVSGRSAEAALKWEEMAPVHARCAELLQGMPPRLTRVLGLNVRLPTRSGSGAGAQGTRRNGDGSGIERARAEIIASFDDGDTTVAFAQGATVMVMRGSDPVEKRARELKEGDQVVLPPQDVVDDIARDLGWAGEQAMIDNVVDRYKKAVGTFRTGPGAQTTASQIAQRMQATDSSISVPSTAAIRYWLSAADQQDKATPFAPGRADWFAAFCKVIGFVEGDSGDAARHFHIFRARLRHEGHVRTGLVERMLFDRYDATIRLGISQERVDELKRRALRFVREVAAIEKGGLWEEEAR
jgi:hypothetical protein